MHQGEILSIGIGFSTLLEQELTANRSTKRLSVASLFIFFKLLYIVNCHLLALD